jgi:hypothetical protein
MTSNGISAGSSLAAGPAIDRWPGSVPKLLAFEIQNDAIAAEP